jgi:hypothetical protein
MPLQRTLTAAPASQEKTPASQKEPSAPKVIQENQTASNVMPLEVPSVPLALMRCVSVAPAPQEVDDVKDELNHLYNRNYEKLSIFNGTPLETQNPNTLLKECSTVAVVGIFNQKMLGLFMLVAFILKEVEELISPTSSNDCCRYIYHRAVRNSEQNKQPDQRRFYKSWSSDDLEELEQFMKRFEGIIDSAKANASSCPEKSSLFQTLEAGFKSLRRPEGFAESVDPEENVNIYMAQAHQILSKDIDIEDRPYGSVELVKAGQGCVAMSNSMVLPGGFDNMSKKAIDNALTNKDNGTEDAFKLLAKFGFKQPIVKDFDPRVEAYMSGFVGKELEKFLNDCNERKITQVIVLPGNHAGLAGKGQSVEERVKALEASAQIVKNINESGKAFGVEARLGVPKVQMK